MEHMVICAVPLAGCLTELTSILLPATKEKKRKDFGSFIFGGVTYSRIKNGIVNMVIISKYRLDI